VLKDSKILLCDEATSALDTSSEAHIMQALGAVAQGRSTIMIAHRLSTVVNANKIIVLNQGKIVEAGSHGELMALDGTYAEMWRQQASAKQDVEEEEEGEAASLAATR
ncbi:P-loop containing nucleoside triphosphate hydrolase protein, partial [Baffinella frigidus]